MEKEVGSRVERRKGAKKRGGREQGRKERWSRVVWR